MHRVATVLVTPKRPSLEPMERPMAQATLHYSTLLFAVASTSDNTMQLSQLIRDPFVRRAFEHGERDNGAAFAVPAPKPLPISGGAVREMEDA